MSMNTKTIPLNSAGALELGMKPCDACNMGWSSHSKNESKSCQDNCIYWKKYCKGKYQVLMNDAGPAGPTSKGVDYGKKE